VGRPNKQPPEPLPESTDDLVARRLLWPIDEAAYLLGCHRVTLWRRIQAGDLRVVRVGRRTWVPDAELHRYVANLEAAS
jgi:excisionase family DNA binding protein